VTKVNKDQPARRGRREMLAYKVPPACRDRRASMAAPHPRCASWSARGLLLVAKMRPWSPLFVLQALLTERDVRRRPKRRACVCTSGETVHATKGVLAGSLGAAPSDRLP